MHKFNEIGKRLRQLRGPLTQQDFVEKLKVPLRTYKYYESGQRMLRPDVLYRIAAIANVPVDWILTGSDQPRPKADDELREDIRRNLWTEGERDVSDATVEHLLVEQKKRDINEGPSDDYVFIPQVNGTISAGGGMVADNTVEMRISFRRDWIARRGNPQGMSIIRVQGDSMEPTLQSGDIVLVDHGRNVVDPHGGIYAIASGDTIMIKRLQLVYPSSKLRIISDNGRYEPIEADPAEVSINGKVIWFGRELER